MPKQARPTAREIINSGETLYLEDGSVAPDEILKRLAAGCWINQGGWFYCPMPATDKCGRCGGRGGVSSMRDGGICYACNGTGKRNDYKSTPFIKVLTEQALRRRKITPQTPASTSTAS